MADVENSRKLFGVAPKEAGPPSTMREAAARARWIALDLDAARFSVFTASSLSEHGKLTLCFDSDFPQSSTVSRAIAGPRAQELLGHARRSTLPCWWTPGDSDAEACPPPASAFLRKIAAPMPGQHGLAFPVYGERGQGGLVVFIGHRAAITDRLLFDIHSRCFSLFEAVVGLTLRSANGPGIAARELECLKLCSHGLTSEEIAETLKLSPHTVNQYLTNTARKLGAVNRIQAVSKALRLGLIE
jgi:DNA-binding CsgD family transcriptional regulator